MSPYHRKRLVVAGHGMVAHRFVQAAIERGLTETHDVLVLGEEPRAAYDRVALTSWFAHTDGDRGSDALSLLPGGEYDDPRVRVLTAVPPPQGWLGKPNACAQGAAAAADADVLVFLDADVRLVPDALAAAVAVSVLGITSTMSLSVLERTRENSLLRALGLSRAQLGAMIRREALVISAAAGVLEVGPPDPGQRAAPDPRPRDPLWAWIRGGSVRGMSSSGEAMCMGHTGEGSAPAT